MAIKITRNLLDEYRDMRKKRTIPMLEWELSEMLEGDNGFGNSTIFDYRTGEARPQSVVGFDWEKYERREKALMNKKAEARAVEEWINDIEDGQTRCVFRMYYIDGMSWLKIADKIKATGDHREDYARICIRDAYLKKCGII